MPYSVDAVTGRRWVTTHSGDISFFETIGLEQYGREVERQGFTVEIMEGMSHWQLEDMCDSVSMAPGHKMKCAASIALLARDRVAQPPQRPRRRFMNEAPQLLREITEGRARQLAQENAAHQAQAAEQAIIDTYGACPRGGVHQWLHNEYGSVCAKCMASRMA